MKLEQLDLPLGEIVKVEKKDVPEKKEEKVVAERDVFDKLDEKDKGVVSFFLGTKEQIYREVKAVLDALERNQAGSYEVGKPLFYNNIIKARGQKLSAEQFKVCKMVIDDFVVKVSNNSKQQQEEAKELDKIVDDHHASLDMEETKEERRELDKKDASLYGGEEYIDK